MRSKRLPIVATTTHVTRPPITAATWAGQPYWLIKKGTPGIDGGLMPRRGPGPAEMQAVNSFVCTVDVADCDATAKHVTEIGGSIALAKMPIPTVGWLAYAKDTEGNMFGFMQMDANAK